MSNPNAKDNDKDEDEFASFGIFDGCVDFEVWVGGQFVKDPTFRYEGGWKKNISCCYLGLP